MRYDIAIAVALIVIAVLAMILYGRRRQLTKMQVFQHGTVVTAIITKVDQRQVEITTGDVINQQSVPIEMRYYIAAEWLDTQTQRSYSFLSDPLISLAPEVKVGDSIQIKIDPARPDEGYFVDTSTIKRI